MKIIRLYYLLCASAILLSCNNRPKVDTPTQGNISMLADENYQPIIDAGLEVFQALYVQAKIKSNYLPEADMYKLFMEDSVQVIATARTLTPDEIKYFEGVKIVPKVTEIAHDAIALIVHPSFGKTEISIDQLKQIVTGQIKDWSALGKPAGEIRVVLDNKNSSCARYIVDSLSGGLPLSDNVFAVVKNEEVIKYVEAHVGAIGIIGVNWISDMDDPQTQKFVNNVEVVAVSSKLGNDAFKPYQAYIATKDYPLHRSLYIISRQGRNGLGTGFASFMASDRGQRIILKSGLVPATMPIRLVEVKDKMPQ